jgi:hypothetical protein
MATENILVFAMKREHSSAFEDRDPRAWYNVPSLFFAGMMSNLVRAVIAWPRSAAARVAGTMPNLVRTVLVWSKSVATRVNSWESRLQESLAMQCYRALAQAFSLIPTYFYIFWLGLSLPLKVVITYSSSVALVVTGMVFAIEAGTAIFHGHLINFHFPLPLRLGVVLVAWIMMRHRLHEFRSLKRKPVFLTNLHLLLQEAASLNFASASDDEERRQKLHDFIIKVLISFRAVFSDIGELQLNVMFPNAAGQLQIMHRFPENAPYEEDWVLATNQGGAGVAYASSNLLYIPRVKYRHGISIGMPPPGNSSSPITYHLKELVYVPTKAEPYRSILSAPVHSATGVVGVLNIDAKINNPFADSEFETAQVAASFIAMALDRYRTSS